jgi:ABC-type methionine transport system permease subunit
MHSMILKVALAVGISLSVAAISSLFITMVASQNLTGSISSGGDGAVGTQPHNQTQQFIEQNNASSSDERK